MDITPPSSVSLMSPSSGATVSGTASFTGTASDNIAVSRVEFWCDGSVLLGTATTAPYTISYNSAAAANGTHNFTCKAYDSAGNSTTSAAIGATVSNTAPPANTWVKRFGGTGIDNGSVGQSPTKNHFPVVTPGGGVDLRATKHLAARLKLDFPLYATFGDVHKGLRLSLGSDGHQRAHVANLAVPLETARAAGIADADLYDPLRHGSKTQQRG